MADRLCFGREVVELGREEGELVRSGHYDDRGMRRKRRRRKKRRKIRDARTYFFLSISGGKLFCVTNGMKALEERTKT